MKISMKEHADCHTKIKAAETRVANMLEELACLLSAHGSDVDEAAHKLFKTSLGHCQNVKDSAEFEMEVVNELIIASSATAETPKADDNNGKGANKEDEIAESEKKKLKTESDSA